jgi:kanamycin kinase
LEQPERICDVFAESISKLHDLPPMDCPRDNGLQAMTALARQNYRMGKVEKGLLRYLGIVDREEAYKEMLGLVSGSNGPDGGVIIHGDCCLPNLILNDFVNSGFVDVGYGGLGDRHYDVFWGIWSLEHNLRTNRFTQRFVDAYGRHKVDVERLRLCGLLSAFNGFRGQDYYE